MFICPFVCLFYFFVCLAGFFLQANAYQNGPILYLLHLQCLPLLNYIFAFLRNTCCRPNCCYFFYGSMEINLYFSWTEMWTITVFQLYRSLHKFTICKPFHCTGWVWWHNCTQTQNSGLKFRGKIHETPENKNQKTIRLVGSWFYKPKAKITCLGPAVQLLV